MKSREITEYEPVIDVAVENHGSLFLIRPFTDEAGNWIAENVADDAQYFGSALVVEPRYVEDIVEGMKQAGLVIA